MTTPDLLKDLEAVALLLDDLQSQIGPRRPDKRDDIEREQWDEIENAKAKLRTHHAEIAEAVADARRWRVARNNTGDGLRLIRWGRSQPEELQVMFPSPTLCDSDADAAIDAQHNSAREGWG